jgi:parvulin-like peptidyl-prolyl isomerase
MSECIDNEMPAGETLAGARKRILLRLLAEREAQRLGIEISQSRVQELARWFRGRFDLLTRADMEAFLAASGLSLAQFTRTMQAMAALDAVQRHYTAEIEAALPAHRGVMSVRDFILLREQAEEQP